MPHLAYVFLVQLEQVRFSASQDAFQHWNYAMREVLCGIVIHIHIQRNEGHHR